jgi:hypothetical protein
LKDGLRATAINYGSVQARNNVTPIKNNSHSKNNIIPKHQIFRFTVRIAHARYKDASLSSTTNHVYNEGWSIGINRNISLDYDELKNALRGSMQAKLLPYFGTMTKPTGKGHWLMAQNHLNTTPARPYL